jgi:Zn finger protein HypA/HybF involved in hydrogenase expression
MKQKLDNKRPVKVMQCKYCLTEFESKTKKTLCPKCRYIKDKECKKQWARKNIKRKKSNAYQIAFKPRIQNET